MTTPEGVPVPHPARAIALRPLVRLVQADIQLSSPVSDPVKCLEALQSAFPAAELVLPTLTRRDGDGGESIYFALVNGRDSCALAESGIIVDTVAYHSWERFSSVIREVVGAIAAVTPTESTLVDLSYVDEISRSSQDLPGISGFQRYVRFPLMPDAGPFAEKVERSYGGYRFSTPDAVVRMEWSITEQTGLAAEHPLARFYEAPDEPALVMDWSAHVHGEDPVGSLEVGYKGISEVFWDAITSDTREMMGLST